MVRVRLDRKLTAISLLVVIGVRADGQTIIQRPRALAFSAGHFFYQCSPHRAGTLLTLCIFPFVVAIAVSSQDAALPRPDPALCRICAGLCL
jgi:hypothetical protein